jgi:hypothetical protein
VQGSKSLRGESVDEINFHSVSTVKLISPGLARAERNLLPQANGNIACGAGFECAHRDRSHAVLEFDTEANLVRIGLDKSQLKKIERLAGIAASKTDA